MKKADDHGFLVYIKLQQNSLTKNWTKTLLHIFIFNLWFFWKNYHLHKNLKVSHFFRFEVRFLFDLGTHSNVYLHTVVLYVIHTMYVVAYFSFSKNQPFFDLWNSYILLIYIIIACDLYYHFYFMLFYFEFSHDYLAIYDGASKAFPMLGKKYCGTSAPPNLHSSGTVYILGH